MNRTASDRGRDRDDEGRARSARPRDGLGRPLPYGAEGVPRQPEGVVRTPEETLREAQRLLDAGMPFHAHEVFEDAWKSGPESERDLWQGLAQLAVGLTHAARGNTAGGARLLRRGADRLAGGPGSVEAAAAYGIDAGGLVAWARELADRATEDGEAGEAGEDEGAHAGGGAGSGKGSGAAAAARPVVDAASEAPRLRLDRA
ncbi:DUF309 domain-containing protein [Streptomyces sp. TX20-6-3]|uniref:DUF309 domain-containing protein n=1 Tax=Streptomyces sp. TX20-6-3 TaxID=3028705 RepID=UPI0029A2F0CF|nr:DUF309 domain-containing protein [Streptomyces sp. TX20-6-3]MDX2561702.1 DUF309 domain-containing protein [Streptomyces sp. TX20-6-3]